MTTDQTTTLIFKDQAGDYYLLPQETLEQGRVPAEHKAEVERLIAEAEGDDVSGHVLFLAGIAVGLLAGGAGAIALINYGLDPNRFPTPNDVPTIQFPPSQEPVRGPGGGPA